MLSRPTVIKTRLWLSACILAVLAIAGCRCQKLFEKSTGLADALKCYRSLKGISVGPNYDVADQYIMIPVPAKDGFYVYTEAKSHFFKLPEQPDATEQNADVEVAIFNVALQVPAHRPVYVRYLRRSNAPAEPSLTVALNTGSPDYYRAITPVQSGEMDQLLVGQLRAKVDSVASTIESLQRNGQVPRGVDIKAESRKALAACEPLADLKQLVVDQMKKIDGL